MKTHLSCLVLVLLVIPITFGLTACSKSRDDFASAIEHSAMIVKDSTNQVMSISSMTDFKWDRLFIFGPYTPAQRIYEQLGYKWLEAESTQIQSLDTFYLLVFLKDGKVISYFKSPRTVGDFQNLETRNVFSPGDDVFEVKSSGEIDSKRLNFYPKK